MAKARRCSSASTSPRAFARFTSIARWPAPTIRSRCRSRSSPRARRALCAARGASWQRRRRRGAGLRDRHRSADAGRRDRGPARRSRSRRRKPRRATIAAHREAFARAGLEAAWPRVIALVVQPGVEFDHHKVIDYQPGEAQAPRARSSPADPQFVFEAHSTDYQTAGEPARAGARSFRDPEGGTRRDLRAARDAVGARRDRAASSRVMARCRTCAAVVVDVMRADPRHWRGHYRDADSEASISTCSSASAIASATTGRTRTCSAPVSRCSSGLRRATLPLTLLSQYLPRQYDAVRAGRLTVASTRCCATASRWRCGPTLRPAAARPERAS